MTKYALILNGVVDTTAFSPEDGFVPVPDDVFGGFIANPDGTFTNPDVPAWPVLEDLTPKEFWRGALSIGITEAGILADIAAIPDLTAEQKEDLKIAVSKATSFSRNDPDLVFMLNYKGFDAAQIDTLWLWVLAQRETVALVE